MPTLQYNQGEMWRTWLVLYILYNLYMKTVSTTEARKNIKALVDVVRETGAVFAIGRRDNPEVLLMKFPRSYNKKLSEITNINAYSESFSFLEKESDTYSVDDLKKKYA